MSHKLHSLCGENSGFAWTLPPPVFLCKTNKPPTHIRKLAFEASEIAPHLEVLLIRPPPQFEVWITWVHHTIRKVKFLSKNSILIKPRHFHEFLPNKFLTIFLVKSKLSTVKKSKTTTFSRVFLPQKIDNFLGKSKLNF